MVYPIWRRWIISRSRNLWSLTRLFKLCQPFWFLPHVIQFLIWNFASHLANKSHVHLAWHQSRSYHFSFFDRLVCSMLKIYDNCCWSFATDFLVVSSFSSSNVAHDVHYNYLQSLSKKMPFFGLSFKCFFLLFFFIIQPSLGGKWWNLRLWHKVGWYATLSFITFVH